MTDRNFRVIKGGLDAPLHGTKEFVSAYVTDTRLMGVTGLYIHWHLVDADLATDFHQFYYFDAEEYGFETYKSIVGNDVAEISLIESALLGGLGGKKVDLSEEEARFLVQDYVRANEELSLPLPDGKEEYQFILDKPISLTLRQRSDLMKKMCDEVHSVHQVINYFLMRCFGRDYYAAKYLTNGRIDIRLYDDYPISTLCKNTIDICDEETNAYLCESLIEYNGTYHIIISEIQVDALLISGFKRRSGFKVSAAEAAMMLSRPEFITVYDILIDNEEVFDSKISEVTSNAMLTLHENGKLFLVFNKNNNHVNKQVFRLNEDIYGMYYVTDYGQMIVASYSIQGIHALEADLRRSSFDQYLVMTAKYEFKEPILYEFIQSDFEDFEDFLEFIKE
ncbi:hypothetical protein [Clostridium aminobutyricum]|uniref:Uncharacterized protein n=1 Tax=Clostridium aminobutyricum TaxID=33953 RepID=A0A939D961_CLOAM|nr:hypothetical protein [Clostridium aminobutyricum]MBN7773013.1 hypothetical protein [Clostridium aminobutyricum]